MANETMTLYQSLPFCPFSFLVVALLSYADLWDWKSTFLVSKVIVSHLTSQDYTPLPSSVEEHLDAVYPTDSHLKLAPPGL